MTRHIRSQPAAAKLNYKWWSNDLTGGVYKTPEAVDDKRVFSTFTGARQALADHFHHIARAADGARYFARNLKEADMKNGEVTL